MARTPAWLGDPYQADVALYSQIRRWFELIILEQDPTTLVGPAAVMKNYHTLGRALKLFWPELVATIVGVGFLIALLFLINVGAAGWAKTLSAILAAIVGSDTRNAWAMSGVGTPHSSRSVSATLAGTDRTG